MKRTIIYFSAAILTLFCACQKEPVIKDSVLTIDSEALYSELNITEEVKTQLNSGAGVIVDSIYVYEASGDLVSLIGVQSTGLEPVSMNIQGLENGNYTIVTFQYFKNKDGQTVWYTADAERLSNLSIRHANAVLDCFLALGVETKDITVQNGSFETTVTPKAAGSIVDFQLEGYVKEPNDHYDLPSIWLYGDICYSGICPGKTGDGYWVVTPEQPEIIGNLEEGQSHRKYFTLINGDNLLFSIQVKHLIYEEDYIIWTYYQDKMSVYPGSNMVCYYNFNPDTFYYSYFGTPEGADAFKKSQSGCDSVFFPPLQWGVSKTDVEKYVSERTNETVLNGQLTVNDNGSTLKYSLIPGLTELYYFNNADATNLARVTFSYEGGLSLKKVKSSMEIQGYKYLGSIIDGVLVTFYYLSPDGQSEFTITPNSDIIYVPIGDYSWTASFFPVSQEDLDTLAQSKHTKKYDY